MSGGGELTRERLRAALKRPFRLLEECGSTNVVAKELAAGGERGELIVVARRQSAGKGRLGREWFSNPDESLTFSVLIRPRLAATEAPLVCLAAAVGVARATGLGIKWPNDILDSNGRKVAGVLAEVELSNRGDVEWMIVGIGVNVAQKSFPPELPNPGSLLLAGAGPLDRVELLGSIEAEFDVALTALQRSRGELLELWRSSDVTVGREVRVGEVAGRAIALREDGALMVRSVVGGEERDVAILSGDVEMVRAANKPL